MDALFAAQPRPHQAAEGEVADRYYTPDLEARNLAALLPIQPGARILEPHVGGGAWVRALRETVPGATIIGNDLDPNARGLALCDEQLVGDATRSSLLTEAKADWVVGNPPYGTALEDHIRCCVLAAHNCALLVRLGALASAGRFAGVWSRSTFRPTHFWALSDRIRFNGASGTDMYDLAFIWWCRGLDQEPTFNIVRPQTGRTAWSDPAWLGSVLS